MNALALRAKTAAFAGTRAQLRVQDGNVNGYLTLARSDRRAAVATYALRIENDSPQPLTAQLRLARRRCAIEPYAAEISIAPFSIKETLLPVELRETGPYDRAIVEVRGAYCDLTIEAPAPGRGAGPRWYAWVASCALAVIGCAFGAGFAAPRITALDVPERAVAGAVLDIPYESGGAGTLRFDISRADGTRVSAGILGDRIGVLHARAARGETIRLRFDGPLGSAERSARVDTVEKSAGPPVRRTLAAATAPSSEPLIGEISVMPASPRAGELVRISATTRAARNDVWLVDLSGTLLAGKPMAAAGATWLRVPANAGGRQLRVVVHATDGKAQAASSVGVVVLPRIETPASETRAAGPGKVTPIEFTLAKAAVASGEEIVAVLRGAHDDAHVTLTDEKGVVVAQGDVGAGENRLTLTAPAVERSARYYVVANVTSGTSTQSFVREVNVAP